MKIWTVLMMSHRHSYRPRTHNAGVASDHANEANAKAHDNAAPSKSMNYWKPWLMMAAVALTPLTPLRAQSAFTEGLVAYYPFRGNANDAWGGLDGEMFGEIVPTENRAGQPGYASQLNGASYVEVPDSPSIRLQNLTIAFWVWFDRASDIINLANKDDYFKGYQLYAWDGRVFFSVGDGDWHTTEGQGHVAPNQWHHLAATYDSRTIRVYVDGINTDAMAHASTLAYGTNSLQISRNGAFGGQFLTGRLSDFRLYNRALPSEEIDALYFHELAVLGARKVDHTLVLSWHWLLTAAGYRLESAAATGPGAIWAPVPTLPVDIGDQQVVTLDLNAGSQFFRLRKP